VTLFHPGEAKDFFSHAKENFIYSIDCRVRVLKKNLSRSFHSILMAMKIPSLCVSMEKSYFAGDDVE
jgi:hypothetical protein